MSPSSPTRVTLPGSLRNFKGSSDIEWSDTFDDGYLTNFEIRLEDTDLKNGINPFAFGN